MADEHELLEGLEDIPDPAAHLAGRAPPPLTAAPAEPSLTRPARERRVASAILVGLAWVLLLTWIAGFRADIGSPRVAIPLALWALLSSLGLLLALTPRARGLPAGVRALQALVAAVPAGFLAAAVATSGLANGPLSLMMHLKCSAIGLGMALPPLALAAFVLRRSFLSAPAWRGAAIGALCGLGAVIGIQAHCSYDDVVHVAFAHGLPIAAGALLGAAGGALRGRA
ncbi:NrsF family protein [Sorangium sp. So ce131]|uniref:NrsF family protein n=1 Tax=Sorangium sp. So ce131 TaxID=3133282 RepID=UPI003F5D9053